MLKKVFTLTVALLVFGANFAFAANKNEVKNMKKITQTAGRTQLGSFAPEFAHFNDDILFGENWNNQDIDLKTRSIITVVSLMSMGIVDNSLKYHLETAKNNGVTKAEMAAIITHTAFYAGWPKAWAVFNLAKTVWTEDSPALNEKDRYQKTIFFPIGEPNNAYAGILPAKATLRQFLKSR